MNSEAQAGSLFSGIIPYLVSPVDASENIDVAALARLSTHLVDQGVHGLTPLGSTGECAYLSFAQRCQVVETVVQAAQGRVPVIPGVSSLSTQDAIVQARAYEGMGANGIVLTLDSYFPLSQAEVESYFMAVAEAVNLPIILYTNPNFQRVDLGNELIGRLSQHERFVGIKDASNNTGRLLSLQRHCRPGFGIYAASSHIAVAVMLLGGQGWFAGPACVLPRESARLYELCRAGQWEQAMALQAVLWRFNEAFARYRLAACIKAALNLQGFNVGNPIAPQTPLQEPERQHIARLLAELDRACAPFLGSR